MPIVPHTPASAATQHELLVAALDAGDLAGAELARATDLVATCDGCAELLADLAALRAAARALPAPRRTRDYRLTEEDAARLRPTPLRRLIGWLAAPRSSVRPLAGGLAALGIAGLLFASIPGIGGVATSAPASASQAASANDTTRNASESAAPLAPAGNPETGGTTTVGGDAGATPPALAPSAVALPSPAASAAAFANPAASPAASGPSSRAVENAPSRAPEAGPSSAPHAVLPGASSESLGAGYGSKATVASNAPGAGSVSPAAPGGTTGGGVSLALLSAVLLAAGVALFGARLVARRLA